MILSDRTLMKYDYVIIDEVRVFVLCFWENL